MKKVAKKLSKNDGWKVVTGKIAFRGCDAPRNLKGLDSKQFFIDECKKLGKKFFVRACDMRLPWEAQSHRIGRSGVIPDCPERDYLDLAGYLMNRRRAKSRVSGAVGCGPVTEAGIRAAKEAIERDQAELAGIVYDAYVHGMEVRVDTCRDDGLYLVVGRRMFDRLRERAGRAKGDRYSGPAEFRRKYLGELPHDSERSRKDAHIQSTAEHFTNSMEVARQQLTRTAVPLRSGPCRGGRFHSAPGGPLPPAPKGQGSTKKK